MLFIFSTPALITHLWQLKTVVFLHWWPIPAVLFKHSNIHCQSINNKEKKVSQNWQEKCGKIYFCSTLMNPVPHFLKNWGQRKKERKAAELVQKKVFFVQKSDTWWEQEITSEKNRIFWNLSNKIKISLNQCLDLNINKLLTLLNIVLPKSFNMLGILKFN